MAERSITGAWQSIENLPTPLAPAWAEVHDELAREVLYVSAVAALWPGVDPWSAPATRPDAA